MIIVVKPRVHPSHQSDISVLGIPEAPAQLHTILRAPRHRLPCHTADCPTGGLAGALKALGSPVVTTPARAGCTLKGLHEGRCRLRVPAVPRNVECAPICCRLRSGAYTVRARRVTEAKPRHAWILSTFLDFWTKPADILLSDGERRLHSRPEAGQA